MYVYARFASVRPAVSLSLPHLCERHVACMSRAVEEVAESVLTKNNTSLTSFGGGYTTRSTFYTTQGSERDARRTKEAEDITIQEDKTDTTNNPLQASHYYADNAACGGEAIHLCVSSMRAESGEPGTQDGRARDSTSSRPLQTPEAARDSRIAEVLRRVSGQGTRTFEASTPYSTLSSPPEHAHGARGSSASQETGQEKKRTDSIFPSERAPADAVEEEKEVRFEEELRVVADRDRSPAHATQREAAEQRVSEARQRDKIAEDAGRAVAERIALAHSMAAEFHKTHAGEGVLHVAAHAAVIGLDPVEAVGCVIRGASDLPHSKLAYRALEIAGRQRGVPFAQSWLRAVDEFTEEQAAEAMQARLRQVQWQQAQAVDTYLREQSGSHLLSPAGGASVFKHQLPVTLEQVPDAHSTPKYMYSTGLSGAHGGIPASVFNASCGDSATRDAATQGLAGDGRFSRGSPQMPSFTAPSTCVSSPFTTSRTPLSPASGSPSAFPAVLLQLCIDKGWNDEELRTEPTWFAKTPLNSIDNALTLRDGLHSYEALVIRALRKAQQALQWKWPAGKGLLDNCSTQRISLLLNEEVTSSTALAGTVKSRNTLVYLRMRAPIREILADGRLYQLLMGESVQDAANHVLYILLEACRAVTSLASVVDRCRTYVTDALADVGIEKVLDLIDAEFLRATDRETRAVFERSVWEVGSTPKEMLVRLTRLGCEMGHSDATIFARWQEAIKSARDEEGSGVRPGEQYYVNRVIRRFTNPRYRFQTTWQLEADLDDDNDMKEPLRAREDSTQDADAIQDNTLGDKGAAVLVKTALTEQRIAALERQMSKFEQALMDPDDPE